MLSSPINLTDPLPPAPLLPPQPNSPIQALPSRWSPEVHKAVKGQTLSTLMTAQRAISICSAGIAHTSPSAGIAYTSLPQQAQHVQAYLNKSFCLKTVANSSSAGLYVIQLSRSTGGQL